MNRWTMSAGPAMRALLVLAVALGLVVVMTPIARADDGVRAEADRIMRMTLGDFVRHKQGEPGPYDWSDDGCSGPAVVRVIYRDLFDEPCQQHDFGYRNYGHGDLQLSMDEDTRDWIDSRFLQEMRRLCHDNFDRWYQRANKATCLAQAGDVWAAVRHGGRDAFYH